MGTLELRILFSRLFTPLQDCKACNELSLMDVDEGQAEYKAMILEKTEQLLLDAQDQYDEEINKKEEREKIERFINSLIDLREKCFHCTCERPVMLEFHEELLKGAGTRGQKSSVIIANVKTIGPFEQKR